MYNLYKLELTGIEQALMNNSIIAHYRIVKKLGCGGMAEVYQAKDIKSNEPVALKILLPHLVEDEVVRQRFLREAKVGMDLNHPGIARVYEVGEDNNRFFIAMELVKGKSLQQLIEHTPLSLRQAIAIAQQVADALAVAHRQGIVHRDIKPGNIMVTGDKVKLMDFGLARVVDTTSLTDKHEVIGTLYYMSPEQVIGEKVDCRTDIYSLGITLYHMITNRLPFQGDHVAALIHAILYANPQ